MSLLDRQASKKSESLEYPIGKLVTVGSNSLGDDERFVSINLEINLAYQSTNWWINIGANVHVCADKFLFPTYQVSIGNIVEMGNSTAIYVRGEER